MTPTTVWVAPSATSFSCLCEPCLDATRQGGELFAEALASARVHGLLALETETAVVRCREGHELVLRRVARPPGLERPDKRQLQLA